MEAIGMHIVKNHSKNKLAIERLLIPLLNLFLPKEHFRFSKANVFARHDNQVVNNLK